MLPIQKVEELAGCQKSRCMQCTVCICGKVMEEMKREREREKHTSYRYPTTEYNKHCSI